MKKGKLLLASTLLLAGSLVSCGNNDNGGSTPAPAEKEARVALGYSISYEALQYGAVKNLATFDIAAVAFDTEGKIVDCRFDSQQVYVGAVAEGEGYAFAATTNVVDGYVKSKLELGKDYNMHLVNVVPGNVLSAAGEVDTQIEKFADYCVGKTVNQVLATEEVEGVTIAFGMYQAALENAALASRARDTFKYTGDLKVGVGISNASVGISYGNVEVSSHFAAAAVVDGKVAASFVDCGVIQLSGTPVVNGEALQINALETNKYLVNGKYTSKYDLHDAYAMKGTSAGIGAIEGGAEWDAQAASFDAYCAGKTANQIAAIEELTAANGVTMAVSDLVAAVSEAAKYAELDHVGPQW